MEPLTPVVALVRHGQTQWSLEGRHTSTTDVPLTKEGRRQARALAAPLSAAGFDVALSSPMARAIETAQLAGFGDSLEIWDDLAEWNYGRYEGITTQSIREAHPGWNIFEHGAPDGESPRDIGERATRVTRRLRDQGARRVVVFSHGHFLRVLGARWIDLDAGVGIRFVLDTASLSELGYERSVPALTRWNDTSHLGFGDELPHWPVATAAPTVPSVATAPPKPLTLPSEATSQ